MLCRPEKLLAILGSTQGIGAYRPDPMGGYGLQSLPEAGQAVQPAVDCFLGQASVFYARPQLDLFRQGFDRAHLAVLDFCDDQVK